MNRDTTATIAPPSSGRAPVRITFHGHLRQDTDLLLIFAVIDATGDEHHAAVAVDPFTRDARFPHDYVMEGESISPVIDAALRERARETIALLDVATTWTAMTRALLRAA